MTHKIHRLHKGVATTGGMTHHALGAMDTDLLSKEDLQSIRDLASEIKHDWDVRSIFRTETEARISVLNELHFPTPFARYWQSVREQQVHFEELVRLSFQYRRFKIEALQIEDSIKAEMDKYRKELLEIDLEEKRFNIAYCEKIAAERVREIKQWSKIKAEEAEKDPCLDTNNPDGIQQLKSYTEQFIWEMFNSGQNIPPADAQNILGKALTAKKECIRLGVWSDVEKSLRKRGLTENHFRQIGA